MRKIKYGLFFFIALNLTGISMQAFGSKQIESVQEQLAQLEASSDGRLGVAAMDTGNNQRILYRANEYFPMGCTSKVIGVAAILKKSMKNNQLLQEKVMYKKNDLTNWTPITEKHLTDGMTVAELCAAAISYSDNTAMNLLTKKLGGPTGLNTFARSIQDKHFKLNHWWPDEALSSPESREDESTPAAMEASLRKLILGDVLASSQREMLMTWLKNNITGENRIRAGVPKGWVVGDKTGSGFHYGTTNDIAVIWPPKCAPIIVTIFYSSNKKDSPKREDILSSATRIIINAYAQTNECIKSGLSIGSVNPLKK
ncbi:MAG: class A beta-lactamase [Gammaproteobacteria bacterium]|nr:class A beta-lactamase [Gammaproteobacteria bacterium]MCW5584322.1 class A beta-lactamase [Gammaproteobacteria bacterium]